MNIIMAHETCFLCENHLQSFDCNIALVCLCQIILEITLHHCMSPISCKGPHSAPLLSRVTGYWSVAFKFVSPIYIYIYIIY